VTFSRSIEYAVHSLIYLAGGGRRAGGKQRSAARPAPILVGEIARAIRVPESYLRKVMQLLARAGLVVSHRGVRGGFSLAQQASRITLRDIVEAIDGSLPTWCCVKEKSRCGEVSCPVSEAFEQARLKMAESLAGITVAQLSTRIAQRADNWLAVTTCF